MMMTLKRWISALRERIRAFLGLDLMPTRLEIIEIRDQIEKNHREMLSRLVIPQRNPQIPEIHEFTASNLTWEMVQKMELLNLLENPPKES